ncbi:MAG: hypothetical protein HY814_07805, partial [Candidatus Riflebacteria bacterium]|nr:hypothetical protein [Candidatus Riflebacteria bacterium]
MGPVRCPYLLVLAGLIAGSGLLEGAQTPLQAGLSQAASERQAFAIVQVEAAGEPYAAPGLRLVRPGQHPATASQGPSLRIRFSLPTALADVTGALVCEPPVALAWSHAWQEDDFTIGVPAALTAKGSYRLRVTRELVDRARSGRLAPGDTPFEWAGALTRLAFVEVGDLVERRSRQLVHVKLRGVERLLVDAVPVPLSALLRHDLPPVLPSQVLRPRREDDESAKDQALETLSSADTEPESLSARWAAAESSVAGELATTAGPFAGLFGTASPAERQLFVEPPDSSRERRTSLPLAWRQGAARGGPCLVRVRDADFPASAGTGFLLVQVTDLSVAFKRSESALSIWVTSLQSGTVIPGARIFLGLRDHRLLAAGTTGEGGLLALEADAGLDSLDLSGRSAVLGRSRLDLARLVQIIAVTEHDLAFVVPEQHGLKAPVQTRRFKTPDRAVWQAHVFTERGVYRPGDSIRYKVTIRQFDGGVAAAPRTTDGPPPSCAVFLKSPRDQSPVKQRVTL